MVEGKEIRIEYDEEKKDAYGRLLAYVYVGAGDDAAFVNAEAIRLGMATAYPYFPNVRHQEGFASLQREARAAKRGIWSIEGPSDSGPSALSAA